MGLPLFERKYNRLYRSRSESPPSLHERTEHYTINVTVRSKKFETSSGATLLFKGPDGTESRSTEFRKFKIDICRNTPGRASTYELKRDILNKEEVVLKRRAGEGSKPIFDREEIKRAINETEEVEAPRTVGSGNLEKSESESETLKTHSASLSHSPRRTWSRHPREKDHSRERKVSERSYRDHRGRPRDRSRDRKRIDRFGESSRGELDRDRPTEQRVPPERYIQFQYIPVPVYSGNFQPRPLMVGPWMPTPGPFGGNIHSPMMSPLRTFPPRPIRIPPDLYGFRPPLNPRFPQRL